MKRYFTKAVIIYIAKFLGAFALLFFGTEALIGITAPGGYYSGFIDKYLNYVDWLRSSLLHATAYILSLFGEHPVLETKNVLRISNLAAVRIVYSCLGYGVMSFWCAFIFANRGSFKKKALWMLGGLLLIWMINVSRLTLLMQSVQFKWRSFLGWNHHTWFNICAYAAIFIMIYFYDRSSIVSRYQPDKTFRQNESRTEYIQ